MPIVIPPFVQYQGPLVPLRGLWRTAPPEGEKFVTCEIDWGATTSGSNCVQIQLTSNSVVPLSQIAALNVDNSQCGSDVQFLFPDSGAMLVVAAYCQGLFPVFTNALQFYVTAPTVSTGPGSADRTIFQVLNSIPPPVAIIPSSQALSNVVQNVSLGSNSTTPLLTPPLDGTLTGFQILATGIGQGTPATASITLEDGTGHILWAGFITFEPNMAASVPITITGIRQRFNDGLYLVIAQSNAPTATAAVNIYYTVP